MGPLLCPLHQPFHLGIVQLHLQGLITGCGGHPQGQPAKPPVLQAEGRPTGASYKFFPEQHDLPQAQSASRSLCGDVSTCKAHSDPNMSTAGAAQGLPGKGQTQCTARVDYWLEPSSVHPLPPTLRNAAELLVTRWMDGTTTWGVFTPAARHLMAALPWV